MTLKKYKYYFKKPKLEIVKDFFKAVLMAGAFSIVASSPRFWWDFWLKTLGLKRKYQNFPKKKIRDAFYSLLRQGYIKIEKRGKQIYVYLTEKGKAKANWLQINDLKIKRPKKWDKKWRLVIFDISQLKRLYREALRGKLKELGFLPLQKSVWIYPFECKAEIEVLRKFFGLSKKELRLIVAQDIEEDENLRKIFQI